MKNKLFLFLFSAVAAFAANVDLTWTDNANNETGFKIERAPQAATLIFTQIATVGPNVTSYTDANLPSSTSYVYRIRASGATGDSGFSNQAPVTTSPAPSVLLAPTNLTAVPRP